jgi:Carboxypeptidase regulatory-like domain/Metallo-peptidase family M12B Reprolysin-like
MTSRRRVQWVTCFLMLIALGCGGGNNTRPNPSPTPPSPPPPAPWTVSGRVIATLTGAPIAGAKVESFIATATTDSSGQFTLTAPTGPPGHLGITVSASGYRARETVIGLPRTSDLVIDVAATAPPFSEAFYNQLVRDAFERPTAVYPSFRWTTQMRFYLRTLDETLRPVDAQTLSIVRQAIRDGVRLFSNGLYEGIIEEGTAARPETTNWINVDIYQVIPDGDFCGLATTVGGNPMTIKLRLDRCGCGSNKIPADLVIHEVGHAMGLFHVDGNEHVMSNSTVSCTRNMPTAKELHHASLMYARPRGNLDPDRDPGGFTLAHPGGSAGAPGRP